MKRLILHIYDFMTTHKVLAALTLILLLAVGVWRTLGLAYQEDISTFLPKSGQTQKYTEVYRRLGGDDKISLLFTGGTLDDRIEAMNLFDEIWIEQDSTGRYQGALDQVNEDSILAVTDFIASHLPYFLLPEDYVRMDSLLRDSGYIERKILENKQSLLYPSLTTEILRHDPLGISTPVFRRLEAFRPSGNGRMEDGKIFSSDSQVGLLFLTSPFGSSETSQNAELVSFIDRISEQVSVSVPDVSISATGGPVVAVENARRIKKDSVLALLLAGILISLLLWFSYKRLEDVVWILVSIAAGALFALALISLFKSSISIIVLGIGSMIIGIAVNYPLHYIDHLKYQPDKRKALAEQVNPLLVGNLTTVGAFLSLLLLKADAIHDFGFIGAMLLVGTIFFVLVFLPVFIHDVNGPRRTLQLDFSRFIKVSNTGKKIVFAVFLAVTVILFFLSRNVSFDADLHQINYMTPEQEEGFRILTDISGEDDGTETLYIVCEGKNADDVLSRMESIAGNNRDIRSISAFLPSSSEQVDRLSRWEDFWTRNGKLKSEIRACALDAGFSEWALEPFERLVDSDWQVMDLSGFEPIYATIGQTMFLPGENLVRAIAYLSVPVSQKERTTDSFKDSFSKDDYCFFSSDLNNSMVEILNQDFDRLGLICSLIVFLFLWLSFSSIELSIISFIPLLISWIWILGTMHLFGIGFNIINIILATFIFGQGDDYTIFMTEGLMYEYATGKKILRSYKNAVVLSALVMFIGIGALIIAKHPAMRSLAQVTIVGMITVVILAYYIPPLLFNFITRKKDGELRPAPLTLINAIETAFISIMFVLALAGISLWAWLYFAIGHDTEKKRLRYHKVIQSVARLAVRLIPGGKFSINNPYNEDFSEPAIYICNHQSHLDVLSILSLHPKIVFLTNEWAWKLYGPVIKKAEFYPTSYGLVENGRHMKQLIERGYSVVIFPEGTRSEDCSIQRFHRGAFLAARELGVPVLPLFIHGFGYALPKHDFLLRHSSLYLEIGQRFSVPEGDLAAFTRKMRHKYQKVYDRIRKERETAEYMAPFVRSRYLYKGHDAFAECRKVLSKSTFSIVDQMTGDEVMIPDAGYGVYPLLVALCHPEMRVTAIVSEEDQYLTATRCKGLPTNLLYVYRNEK